ncbi:amino acid ABC transporter substrate-binding protein [Oceanisphaera arctica]|uniref:Amino acid ABC transporter substrate-binding protein n=1 Tax=Oceanisphaera arctica TaxID=641510 RepID=A0A2P5TPL5_9GAMM|nr:amino acid ABC transporter substrate-binding protein [Oceanisphaera arctica]PPL17589.1 amino acid ABC transporter substrate-binding protein [Oceanisphaera arctica]GHA16039.1 amino acid ABC transporter substrate-binding protein [Oceanisphaera arctica]
MFKSIKLLGAVLALSTSLLAPAMAADAVKVGMSGRYYPFTFVQQDKLQGFEVDVWNEIGKRLDREVEFVTTNFSGLFGMLETGRIDTISNQITITPERLEKYDFATPYVYDGAQIVVRKGNDSIKGLEDLKGKKVAVNLGSNFEQLMRKHDTNNEINIITYETNLEQDVALGRTDAFVMDRVGSAQLIKEAGLPLQLAGQPFETMENAFPFVKKPQQQALLAEVNQALADMRADGTLTQISEKWLGADITSK